MYYLAPGTLARCGAAGAASSASWTACPRPCGPRRQRRRGLIMIIIIIITDSNDSNDTTNNNNDSNN